MKRLIEIIILAAAAFALPRAARGDQEWLGRFVQLPAELNGVSPAKFPTAVSAGVPGKLPLNSSTYAAICALGDMAMERRYIPSAGGAASAPAGPLLTCMAEDGWKAPRASRHAQLYDFVYGEIARVPETIELDGGAKVYPLCMAGLGIPNLATNASGKCSFGYYDMPPPLFAAGDWGGDNTNAENAAAVALKEMLERRGLRADTSWPETFDNTARFKAKMLEQVGMNRGPDAHPHYYGSGLKTGSPIWAIDPLEANYALSLAYATPVAIPAAAAWDVEAFENETTMTTNRLIIAASEVAEAAERLVRAGGGTATLASTKERVQTEAAYTNGTPLYKRVVEYAPSDASPHLHVRWLCKDVVGSVEWVTNSSKRVTNPNGTLTVTCRRVSSNTTRTLDGVKVTGIGSRIVDEKVNTITRPAFNRTYANNIAWPHESSKWDVGGAAHATDDVRAYFFGRRHRRDVAADGSVTSNAVGAVCEYATSSWVGDLYRVVDSGGREYFETAECDDVDEDDDLGTVTLYVSKFVSIVDYGYSTSFYSVTFDPDPDCPTNYPPTTVYYESTDGWTHSWEDLGPDFTVDSVFSPDNNLLEGYARSSTPPSDDEPYYFVERAGVSFRRDEGTNGGRGYTETKSAWLDLPDVFLFVFWDFTYL